MGCVCDGTIVLPLCPTTNAMMPCAVHPRDSPLRADSSKEMRHSESQLSCTNQFRRIPGRVRAVYFGQLRTNGVISPKTEKH